MSASALVARTMGGTEFSRRSLVLDGGSAPRRRTTACLPVSTCSKPLEEELGGSAAEEALRLLAEVLATPAAPVPAPQPGTNDANSSRPEDMPAGISTLVETGAYASPPPTNAVVTDANVPRTRRGRAVRRTHRMGSTTSED